MVLDITQKALLRSGNRRRRRLWNKLVTGMAAVVVFCTTYALILPAITMEREPTCGIEEHIHDESCMAPPKELTCVAADPGKLVLHLHNEYCYDPEGGLICPLPELQAHVHSDSCYTQIIPELPHVHTDDCREETKVPVCGLEESDGHTHSEGCLSRRLTCALPEDAGHIHDDGCYEVGADYTCGLEECESHKHGDACYEIKKELICGQEEVPEPDNPPQPHRELTCGREEIVPHIHSDSCCDAAGNLICGKPEVFEHVHTAACLTAVTDPATPQIIACGLQEHTHDPVLCFIDSEADLETEALWKSTLPELAGESWADNLLAVAQSQLDYEESSVNVTVTPDGEILGYTRYGQWAGDLYGAWNETFVKFCRHYAGIPAGAFPVHQGKLPWCGELSEENWGIYLTTDVYTPVPGDTVYLDINVDGVYDAMAIVEQLLPATEAEKAKLTVIQGDWENAVRRVDYEPDAPEILGWASTEAAQARWEEQNPASTEPPEEPDYHCGLEAHVHEDACYSNEGNLTCGQEEHTHTELCRIEQKYYCGFEAHVHGVDCMDDDGNQVCTISEHTHTEDCGLARREVVARIEARVLSEDSPGTVITVCGYLPKDAVVKAVPVDMGEGYEDVICAYDISIFTARGEEFQPVIPLTVTFAVPELELTAGDEVSVSYVPKVEQTGETVVYGEEEQMDTAKVNEDGTVSFDAPHFSTYVLRSKLRETGGDNETCANPLTCELHSKTDPAVWEDTTIINPFGGAQGYNLFLLGDVKDWGVVHGNAAIKGNIYGHSNDIAYDLSSLQNYSADITPHFPVGLLLGGERDPEDVLGDTDPVIIKNGPVIARESQNDMGKIQIDNLNISGDHFHEEDPERISAYFAQAEQDLIDENQFTYQYCMGLEADDPHLGRILRVINQYDEPQEDEVNANPDIRMIDTDGLVLRGTNSFYNVFNLNWDQYNAIKNHAQVLYLDVPFGSYTLINIVGPGGENAAVDFAPDLWYQNSDGVYINQPADKSHNPDYTQTQRTLINIDPDIGTLNAAVGNYIYASMLGPSATFHVAPGIDNQLQGTIVLKNLEGGIDAEHDFNPSAILYNPFNAGAQVTLEKSVVCDSEEDNCFICGENGEAGGRWESYGDYYADLTLKGVDDMYAGSVKTLRVEGLHINGEPLTIKGLTPGIYTIEEEFVYRLDDGNKIAVEETDDDQDAYTWLRHYFGYAQFRMNGEEKPTLVVESLDNKTVGVVNHYSVGEVVSHAVSKRWEDTQGSPVAPPVGAFVKVQLWRRTVGSSAREKVGPPVTLSAANGWFYRWGGLEMNPKGEDGRPDHMVQYLYYVTEEEGWDGFTMSGTGETDETGTEILTNRQDKTDGSLRVKKVWKDQNGGTIPPPAGETVTLNLYRRSGSVPDNLSRPYVVTFMLDTGKVDSEDRKIVLTKTVNVAKGSRLDFDMRLFYDATDENEVMDPLAYDLNAFTAMGASVKMESDWNGDVQTGHVYNGTGQAVFVNPYYQKRYIGTIESVNRNITLSFAPKKKAATDTEPERYLNISAVNQGDYEALAVIPSEKESLDQISWNEWMAYVPTDDQPGTVTFPRKDLPDTADEAEKWAFRWSNLPKDNGSGEYYQYFVFEEPLLNGYNTTYMVSGGIVDAVAPGSAAHYPGFTEGQETVVNQKVPGGPELPDCGGMGTTPYTLGGLLTVITAALLMQYKQKKRRKEGNAS